MFLLKLGFLIIFLYLNLLLLIIIFSLTCICKCDVEGLIAVHKDIISSLLVISNSNVEQLFVRWLIYIRSINSFNFILCSIYLTYSFSIDFHTAHLNTVNFIVQKYPNHIFLFISHCNLPFITWSNDARGLCNSSQFILGYICVFERLTLHVHEVDPPSLLISKLCGTSKF